MFFEKLVEHNELFAGVAELADAPDLGSGGEIRRGSSPLSGTFVRNHQRWRHKKISEQKGFVQQHGYVIMRSEGRRNEGRIRIL